MRKRLRPQEPNLKSADDIARIKEAGSIIAEIFTLIRGMNLEGQTTLEIDEFVDREIRVRKARASFATVPGYSHATCISVNDGVVHGIPSKKIVVKKGDIVKIDVGVVKNGFFADACRTFPIDPVTAEAHNLVITAAKSLDIGIAQAAPGRKLGDVGYAIQKYVESRGYSVVRDYTGHGVGFAVHEEPTILHYGKAATGITIRPGMVLAIEPMINAGGYETKVLDDGWTAVTKDGSLSAQFEHTVAVTENGPVILTE